MNSAAPPAYWDSLYASCKLVYREDRVEFKDVFHSHLPIGGDCFEVGCYPGDFLLYLCKTFGYQANGIDTTPSVEMDLLEHFERNGVTVGQFSRQDFFNFTSEKLYDVVCSFGFIEHFQDYSLVIKKHVQLLKPGGTLFISCPNFRYFQFALHRLFDEENLSRHELASMSLSGWRRTLVAEGIDVLASGYYRTCDFWVEQQERSAMQKWLISKITRLAKWTDRRVYCPNRFTSPFMYCVARKPLFDQSPY